MGKLVDTFKQTADTIAFLNRGRGISAPDVQNAIEETYAKAISNTPDLRYVSVLDFGADRTGETPSSISFQQAADYAFSTGQVLFIPSGTYWLPTTVNIRTSVVCHGKLIRKTSDPLSENIHVLSIVRSVTPVSIDPNTLSGLQEKSNQILGLPITNDFVGGTLVLKSSEILINRGIDSYYTKRETSMIKDINGIIYPELDSTYEDMSKLEVELFPYEDPITLSGIHIELHGNERDYEEGTLLYIGRSNVNVIGPTILNKSSNKLRRGIGGADAVNINIIKPTVKKCNMDGFGYGITLPVCSNILIEDGNVTECRHAISGSNMKNVTIRGGLYDSDIDSHWGKDYHIENVITTRILYAGSNLSVKNTTFISGTWDKRGRIVTIRSDTPELKGYVSIRDCHIKKNTENDLNIFSYSSSADYRSDRIINLPDSIVIENITVELPTNNLQPISVVSLAGDRKYPRSSIGSIHINNIISVNGQPIRPLRIYKNSWDIPEPTRINISNIENTNTTLVDEDSFILLRLISWDSEGDYYEDPPNADMGNSIFINDCQGVVLRIDPPLIKEVNITSSQIMNGIRHAGTYPELERGVIRFISCELNDLHFGHQGPFEFIDCVLKGEFTNSGKSLSSKTQYSSNNRAVVGSINYPPLNRIDPGKYITES